MITQADNKRIAYAMNDMLLSEDAQYLIDEELRKAEGFKRTVICEMCGCEVVTTSCNCKRCRKCSQIVYKRNQRKRHAKELDDCEA